jgi:hypothetical protein
MQLPLSLSESEHKENDRFCKSVLFFHVWSSFCLKARSPRDQGPKFYAVLVDAPRRRSQQLTTGSAGEGRAKWFRFPSSMPAFTERVLSDACFHRESSLCGWKQASSLAKPFSGVRPGNQILEALRYFDVWQGQKTQISSSQSVSEDRPGNRFFSNQNYCRHRLKLFEIVRKKSISPRVVWTLVVQIKKTQESTPIIIKRITEDKENIILLDLKASNLWPFPLEMSYPPENNIPAFCRHRVDTSQKSGTIFRNQFFSNNLCPKIGNNLSKSILFE